MSDTPSPRIVFFGTSRFAVETFEALFASGIRPLFLVTTPDRPQGRHLRLSPPPAKIWAKEHGIEVLQPEKLKQPPFAADLSPRAGTDGFDVFIVASYGKLIPADVLSLPKHGTLNIHPSLLPKYRGASPVQSAIIADDRDTGITIMKIDEEMDHGPLIAQKKITPPVWPPHASELKTLLAKEGAALLQEALPSYLAGTLPATPQNHTGATYTGKFEKEDGLLDLSSDGYKNYLRFQALSETPGVFFFDEHGGKKLRIKITGASYKDGIFGITRVIPEGRKEMDFEAYKRGKRP
jgi:methionyl-tRNA formyltransferase